jgi:antitoxin component YwqK of YwqJK toxin-antitoxin module
MYYKGKVEYQKEYYENGQTKSERFYIDGKKNGIFKNWHPNGQLKTQTTYIYDTINGNQEEYHENGQIKRLKIINSGFTSAIKEWNQEGKLTFDEIYEHNKN